MIFEIKKTIRTPYGNAVIFKINNKSIRVRTVVGGVVLKIAKSDSILLNDA